MIRKVKARFDRNPRRIGRKIARELKISRERMQHILKNELGLTDGQKKSLTAKSQGVTSLARKWPVAEFDFLR